MQDTGLVTKPVNSVARQKHVCLPLLLIKALVLLLLVFPLPAKANGSARLITLSEKNVPLENVLHEIGKQTGYYFLITDTIIAKAILVSIEVRNGTVLKVLNTIFKDQPLTFEIFDKAIIVKLKPVMDHTIS